MRFEAKAYTWLTNLLEIPRSDSKDQIGTKLSVFGIKVDTARFIARLPRDKLERAIQKTGKVLADDSVSLLDIQSLVGFLFFCSQAVRLERVFMRRLWDFVNHIPRNSRTTWRRIPAWVREDLEW